MSNIPPELYERVRDFALELTNASLAEDAPLEASLYEQLVTYYQEQSRSGISHPFLTETLADYTDDAAQAVSYYELALQQSKMYPDEPRHTKMISLAERLIEIGHREQAEAYLRDGRSEAVRLGDTDWIQDADRLLQLLLA